MPGCDAPGWGDCSQNGAAAGAGAEGRCAEFWIGELIREKLYLQTNQEVPYTASVHVEQVEDRKDKQGKPLVYIKAVVLTIDDRHQRMLIGQHAKKIKEIGSAARKELEVAMNKKVFLDLDVLIDDEWMDRLN